MPRSPYRRGAPILALGVGIVALVGVSLGLVSNASNPSSASSASSHDRASAIVAPVSSSASAPKPRRVMTIPVETEPAGAIVYRVDDGRHERLCSPTPCAIAVDRNELADMIVSLELRDHMGARAYLKDVADVPGGTLTLAFAPRGLADPPQPGSFPRLRHGTLLVSGGLPQDVIHRVVRQSFGRFRLCYESGLRDQPELSGRVITKLTIDARGATSSAVDAGSDLPHASTVACVVQAFSRLAFPEPQGGAAITVVYPILFTPHA